MLCTKSMGSISLMKSTLNACGRPMVVRQFQRDSRETFTKIRTRAPTLKERAMAPPGPQAYSIGKGALAGGAAFGIGE